MTSPEEIESAEAKMNAAKEELLSYIERAKPLNRDQHQRLLARVKKAESEFRRVIAEFDGTCEGR